MTGMVIQAPDVFRARADGGRKQKGPGRNSSFRPGLAGHSEQRDSRDEKVTLWQRILPQYDHLRAGAE